MARQTGVSGRVDREFERVREAFAANVDEGEEVGASFAAVLGGRSVVDLWGGYTDRTCTKPWAEDTLVNVWSTTKGVVALGIATLVERERFDYSSAVAEIWPEFAAKGKSAVTVGELLSHQAGLCGLRRATAIEDFYDWEGMVAALAVEEPLWPPGTACGYQRLTFGHLAGELIRRVS